MHELAQDPSFRLYAASMTLLCLNLLFLWFYSGAVRSKTKTTPNPEDAVSVAKGAEILPSDPPPVARVLRAHTNATAAIVPFGFLGLFWVVLGAPPMTAAIIFGNFTFFRWVHSFVYLGEKQPWRTVCFVVASVDVAVVMGLVVHKLVVSLGG